MTVVITIHQPSSQVYSQCGYPCPDYCNPSDHLIRTLSIITGQRHSSLRTIAMDGKDVTRVKDEKDRSFLKMQYPASLWAQTKALTWRSWLTVIRDPMLINVRLIQTVLPEYLILPTIYNVIVYWMAGYFAGRHATVATETELNCRVQQSSDHEYYPSQFAAATE
ncbi:hypothetical protein OSTOST_15709 [Ostertagia ostertagi]